MDSNRPFFTSLPNSRPLLASSGLKVRAVVAAGTGRGGCVDGGRARMLRLG